MIDLTKVDEIIERYRGDSTATISLLQDVNEEFRYLPGEALKRIAQQTGIPLSQLFSMATFYKAFHLAPRGEHEIHVCMGTACHVRGAPLILDKISRELGIQAGETSKDGKFSLETVNCLGACALGPLATVDGKHFGKLDLKKTEKLLGGYYEKDRQSS